MHESDPPQCELAPISSHEIRRQHTIKRSTSHAANVRNPVAECMGPSLVIVYCFSVAQE